MFRLRRVGGGIPPAERKRYAERKRQPSARTAASAMGQPRSSRERCSCSNTNCVERPLTRLFEALGRVVAACPWPFVLLPPLLSAGLGAGFIFLPGRQTNDIEGQFTPTGGPAKAERDFVRRYFPTDDSERFSAERLPTEGAYAALIAVAAKDDASVLERAAWDEVLLLDNKVRDAGYERLCARSGGTCASANPLLQLLTHTNGSALPELPELPFPGGGGGGDAFLGTALGGVRTDGSGRVERARAVKLMYYLREDGGAAGESRAWLETFLRDFPAKLRKLNLTAVEVAPGRGAAAAAERGRAATGAGTRPLTSRCFRTR